jgi:hypothetical protein
MPTSKVIFYNTLHSSVDRQFKTFKIKYFGAFGLKMLSKWREKWDESTGIRPNSKKRKPTIPKLSRIKRTAFFIIWAICQQIIQFRLAFKDKGHKSLEYCCQLFSNTFDIRRYNFSFVSTISYAEWNGDIFILIAPNYCAIYRHYKYKVGQTASDLSTNTYCERFVNNTISLDFQRP